MKNNPLVSIVVPVYNVEQYLDRCLDSLINQTYTKTEIIIVNDGSPDNCHLIISNYENKDKRIKVVNKLNGGLASARNAGVAAATGEYIWHIDSDDYAETDCLGKMVATAYENDSDVVVSGYWRINTNKPNERIYVGPRFTSTLSGTDALCLMLCNKIGGDVWTKLYKRSLYTDNNIRQNEDFSVAEDIMLNYQLYAVANKVSPVECISINHIYREGSYSSKSKTRTFKTKHHLGIRYMASYGFATKDIESAYYGFFGIDFLSCFHQYDRPLLQEIDALTIKRFYQYLTYLSCYNLISQNGVKFTCKNKCKLLFVKILQFKPARIILAGIFKLLSIGFKRPNIPLNEK